MVKTGRILDSPFSIRTYSPLLDLRLSKFDWVIQLSACESYTPRAFSVTHGASLVCHICERPASAQCRSCKRYMCTEHTAPNLRRCSECKEEEESRRERLRESVEYLALERKCIVCGDVEDNNGSEVYKTHYQCAICKRYVCRKHGDVYELQSSISDEDGTKYYIWERCKEHPIQPRKSFSRSIARIVCAESPADWVDPPDREQYR